VSVTKRNFRVYRIILSTSLRANLTRLLSCRNISRYLLRAGNSNDGSPHRRTVIKEGKTKKTRWREGARRYRCESHIVSQDKEWVKFSGTWMEYQRSHSHFHIPAAYMYVHTYDRTCIWTNERTLAARAYPIHSPVRYIPFAYFRQFMRKVEKALWHSYLCTFCKI